MHLLTWYENKERNQQLLEEVGKPEEKLSILANESRILSVSFVVISTIFDKAAKLKDGLVIKKPNANGNSFFAGNSNQVFRVKPCKVGVVKCKLSCVDSTAKYRWAHINCYWEEKNSKRVYWLV